MSDERASESRTMNEWINFNGSLYYILRKYIRVHAQYNQFSTTVHRGVRCITYVSSSVRRVDRIDDQGRTLCSILVRIHGFVDFCKSDFSVFNNRSIWFQQVPQPPKGWTFSRDALKRNLRSTDHSGVHRTSHTWHTLSYRHSCSKLLKKYELIVILINNLFWQYAASI